MAVLRCWSNEGGALRRDGSELAGVPGGCGGLRARDPGRARDGALERLCCYHSVRNMVGTNGGTLRTITAGQPAELLQLQGASAGQTSNTESGLGERRKERLIRSWGIAEVIGPRPT